MGGFVVAILAFAAFIGEGMLWAATILVWVGLAGLIISWFPRDDSNVDCPSQNGKSCR